MAELMSMLFVDIQYSMIDGSYNFTHHNGTQTSIKTAPSGHFDEGQMERSDPIQTDKNKYTVIISSSSGCQMSCSFCHLTQNKKPFHNISEEEITENVIDAIEFVANREGAKFTDRYIKLCYMGEGEPILDMEKTGGSAGNILSLVYEKGLAAGLDGIDISTCMPKIPERYLEQVIKMDQLCKMIGFNLNPVNHNDPDRSIVRLFYSLHHYNQTVRNIIIPNSMRIDGALELLKEVSEQGVNVVYHYMFINGVNDSDNDVQNLISFVNSSPNFKDSEFRVLRYNQGRNGQEESDQITNIVKKLSDELEVKKFKVQFSAGEAINAACGMFPNV